MKVSQRTVERVRGVPPQTFLEHAEHPALERAVLKIGKLRIVDLAVYDGFLRSVDAAWRERRALSENVDADDADELLRELGLVPAKPGRKS